MDLRPHISRLQHELIVAADAGGDDARALAERLTAPLESATRLVLLEALSTAAGEISLDLESASVDVRLRGLDPEFVVTTSAQLPSQPVAPAPAAAVQAPDDADGDDGDKTTARFSLRLPERLKPRLEQAADRAGVSVNAWLVRVVSSALDGPDPTQQPTRTATEQRRGGWVR